MNITTEITVLISFISYERHLAESYKTVPDNKKGKNIPSGTAQREGWFLFLLSF